MSEEFPQSTPESDGDNAANSSKMGGVVISALMGGAWGAMATESVNGTGITRLT